MVFHWVHHCIAIDILVGDGVDDDDDNDGVADDVADFGNDEDGDLSC